MRRNLFILLGLILGVPNMFATGEPSTYFQIYVSPNNDAVKRDVCLLLPPFMMTLNLKLLMMVLTEILMTVKQVH